MAVFEWKNEECPADLEVKQVHGMIFDEAGNIILIKNKSYSLIGGKPEKFDSDYAATLFREVLEEINVEICEPCYLGYQLVDEQDGSSLYAQLRYIAKIASVGKSIADIDTGIEYKRQFVSPDMAIKLLNWGEVGKQQICDGVQLAECLWGIRSEKADCFCEF